MINKILIDVFLCVAMITAGSAQAETRREGGTGNSQQHAMAQLMQQNATLEQEKSALTDERDNLKTQLDKLNTTHTDDLKALNSAKDATITLTSRFNDLLSKHVVLQTKDESTQEKLQDAERRNKILNGKIADLAHQNAACEGSNRKLYQLNVELLERYRKKGVIDTLLQHEPVTGLKDVEMQNIIQKYSDKNDEQRYLESTASSK